LAFLFLHVRIAQSFQRLNEQPLIQHHHFRKNTTHPATAGSRPPCKQAKTKQPTLGQRVQHVPIVFCQQTSQTGWVQSGLQFSLEWAHCGHGCKPATLFSCMLRVVLGKQNTVAKAMPRPWIISR